MNPHRYAVVKIGRQQATHIRMALRGDGQVWQQMSDESHWIGEITDDSDVYWVNDINTQRQLLATLQQMYPDNSYALMETTEVVWIPRGEAQRARFTDAGLVPA